jgi:hypothetical protein
MMDNERPGPRATALAGLIAFTVGASVLTLVVGLNHRLYGNPYVFTRQLIVSGVALAVGLLLAVQAASVGRRRRCLDCALLAVGYAIAGWWLVPNADGHNLVLLHLRARRLLSELRSLPPGEAVRFRSEMKRRDQIVDMLPRLGRAIRAEERRWLTESLSGAIGEANSLIDSDPVRVLLVLKEALHDLPGPEEYVPDTSRGQGGFKDKWQRAKKLRLNAAKFAARSRIVEKDYRGAAQIAAALRTDAGNDAYRDEKLDRATEKFIDSVLFLASLNDLSHGRSGTE